MKCWKIKHIALTMALPNGPLITFMTFNASSGGIGRHVGQVLQGPANRVEADEYGRQVRVQDGRIKIYVYETTEDLNYAAIPMYRIRCLDRPYPGQNFDAQLTCQLLAESAQGQLLPGWPDVYCTNPVPFARPRERNPEATMDLTQSAAPPPLNMQDKNREMRKDQKKKAKREKKRLKAERTHQRKVAKQEALVERERLEAKQKRLEEEDAEDEKRLKKKQDAEAAADAREKAREAERQQKKNKRRQEKEEDSKRRRKKIAEKEKRRAERAQRQRKREEDERRADVLRQRENLKARIAAIPTETSAERRERLKIEAEIRDGQRNLRDLGVGLLTQEDTDGIRERRAAGRRR